MRIRTYVCVRIRSDGILGEIWLCIHCALAKNIYIYYMCLCEAGPSVQLQMRQEIEAGSALLAFSSQGETAVTLDIFGDALTQLYDDILAEYARSITCLHQSPAESDGVYSSMDKFNVLRQLVEMRTSLVVQVHQKTNRCFQSCLAYAHTCMCAALSFLFFFGLFVNSADSDGAAEKSTVREAKSSVPSILE